jgi:hypothetical protein
MVVKEKTQFGAPRITANCHLDGGVLNKTRLAFVSERARSTEMTCLSTPLPRVSSSELSVSTILKSIKAAAIRPGVSKAGFAAFWAVVMGLGLYLMGG